MQQRLADSITQWCFLAEFVTFSPLDMERNTETIQWFNRMPSIFKEHCQIVTEKMEQYQSELKVCAFLFYRIYKVSREILYCLTRI